MMVRRIHWDGFTRWETTVLAVESGKSDRMRICAARPWMTGEAVKPAGQHAGERGVQAI